MAPRASSRRTQAQSGALFDLGVQGRKTGVFLPETDKRDEHGMEPIEGIFSSPNETRTPQLFPNDRTLGEAEMELDENTGPGPASMARGFKLPLPRGKSPLKTNLQSPAVRNRNLTAGMSSPARGSIVGSPESSRAAVSRRLDFAAAKTNGGSAAKRVNGVNGHSATILRREDDEDDSTDSTDDAGGANGFDDSLDMVDAGATEELEDEAEHDESPVVEPRGPAKGAPKVGRPRKGAKSTTGDAIEPDEEPVVRRRGRQPSAQSNKRSRALRNSTGSEDAEEDEDSSRGAKRQRTEAKGARTKNARPGRRPAPIPEEEEPGDPEELDDSEEPAAPKATAPKKRGRKRRSSLPQRPAPAAPTRGPPLPKNRGLVSLRREGPDGMTLTRSGRHSYKPLAYWRGEHAETEELAVNDIGRGARFVTTTVREVVRADDPEPAARPRGRGRPAGKAKAKARGGLPAADDAPEPEPWEVEEGEVEGDVIAWRNAYEREPPGPDADVGFRPEKLAISAEAIDFRPVKDSEFTFAKVVSMPFFGSGVLDLPPGAEKLPKNARKMQLVFFVFYGKVLVTVHDTAFRISTGGMFFVPRGNYYSVKNDYDTPARLWFAQACEYRSPDETPLDDEGEE